jgi:hypothetical protein
MTTLLTAVLIIASISAILFFGRKGELLDREEQKKSTTTIQKKNRSF